MPWLIYLSPGCISEPLTPDFMRLLCRDLRNDWERFAKELRIGRARIQSIKQQNKNTIPEKIVMDILANWLKRQPKVDDKVILPTSKHNKDKSRIFIRITCPCDSYPPYTPLLYSKIGVYRGIHNFLIFALKHRLWVLVRTASNLKSPDRNHTITSI